MWVYCSGVAEFLWTLTLLFYDMRSVVYRCVPKHVATGGENWQFSIVLNRIIFLYLSSSRILSEVFFLGGGDPYQCGNMARVERKLTTEVWAWRSRQRSPGEETVVKRSRLSPLKKKAFVAWTSKRSGRLASFSEFYKLSKPQVFVMRVSYTDSDSQSSATSAAVADWNTSVRRHTKKTKENRPTNIAVGSSTQPYTMG